MTNATQPRLTVKAGVVSVTLRDTSDPREPQRVTIETVDEGRQVFRALIERFGPDLIAFEPASHIWRGRDYLYQGDGEYTGRVVTVLEDITGGMGETEWLVRVTHDDDEITFACWEDDLYRIDVAAARGHDDAHTHKEG